MPDIPIGVTDVGDEGEIPKSVAEFDQESEPLEDRPYLISFAKYNEKMCQLDLITSNKARKAIQTFKIVGTKVRVRSDFQRNSIDLIPVEYKGEYKKLYSGLSDDIQLREIKLQQDARVFYFDIEPERIFYVVAITENHLETGKTRR